MKKIGIVTNIDKDVDLSYSTEIAKWLKHRVDTVFVSHELEAEFMAPCQFVDEEQLYKNSDFVIVLGGDGTILGAARTAALYDTPIIGINLGTLGYLTDVDETFGKDALQKVLAGDYKTEKRMMLEAVITDEDDTISKKHLIALNDICVLRGAVSKVITLDLKVNDMYLDTYRADGIIISTPTGSTAYNLSAGGPVLKPDIELIVVTPVCAHKMYSRPSVISADDKVELDIGESHGGMPILSLDGQEFIDLHKGQKVNIYKSQYYTTLIKTNGLGFYDILRAKFHQ